MANEIITETHGRVMLITLNRPKAKNSVNTALAQALVAAMKDLDSDDDLTAGVLTGADGGFSAGMDLKAFLTEGSMMAKSASLPTAMAPFCGYIPSILAALLEVTSAKRSRDMPRLTTASE